MGSISMTASVILQFPNCFGTLEPFPSFLIRYFAKICPCNHCKKYKNHGLRIKKNNEMLLGVSPINELQHIPNQKGGIVPLSIDAMDVKDESFEKDKNDEIIIPKNCYFKLAQYTTRWPYNCIVSFMIFMLMIPAIYVLINDYSPSIDFTMNFPTNADSVDA